MALDFSDVERAARRIDGVANRTPVVTSRTLNARVGSRVYLKCENFQRMGAFKFRGAYNALSQLTEEERSAGVVAHSSGNHAQAVALAAQLLGIKATIVMPEGSPEVKRRATEQTYGATVVSCRNTQADRETATAALVSANGYTLVHPYDNDRVIAGAGTAALELLGEVAGLDTVIAPVGGGGLLSGTCLSAHGVDPGLRVLAAEPEGANDAARSLAAGHPVPNERVDTVADGLRTNLCDRTFAIISRHVERVVTVSDTEILDAMRFLWERMKLVVEPSGAVALAALLSGRAEAGAQVGLIISGGNVDLSDYFSRG